MKIVYLGSSQFGIDCLDALAQSSHTLELIVTQPAQPAGRGRKTKPTPVALWAKEHGVDFDEIEDVNTASSIEKITGANPDLIVVIAFGQKIGSRLINLPAKGIINVHASLLPKYRGAAPINQAIINGETETGVTIITVAEKMDAGDILAQAKTNIGTDETAGELHDGLAKLAAPLLLETIDKIADGSVVYTKQDHSKATRAPKLKKSNGFLDFNEPAIILKRKILGFWPWPGASAAYLSKKNQKSERIIIAGARIIETSNPDNLTAGTLDKDLNLICGKDALNITKIKPDGSRLMNFEDFVNGRHTQPGDSFGKIDK